MTRWVVVACLVFGLAGAAGALAQSSYVTVARSAGAQLQVRARPGGLCVRVTASGAEDRAEDCDDLPRFDLAMPFALDTGTVLPARTRAVGGAVRSGVARVEYVAADGRRFAADTIAAPQLGGRLARALRFYLLELPAGADPVTRRLFDATGRLVDEQDGLFIAGSGADPPPLKGPVRIARGRSSGARWSLYATVRNTLAPVRGDVGRRVAQVCTATTRETRGGTAGCDEAAQAAFAIGIDEGCPGRSASLLHGIAGPGTRVEALLGDGRVHRPRMLALPAGYARAGARAWVLEIPSDTAIRDVRVRDASGRQTADLELDEAPPQLSCHEGVLSSFAFTTDESGAPRFTTPPAVLQPSGGPSLTVRDAGAELCVAVGERPSERDCAEPLPWLIFGLIARSRDGRVAGGAVDPAIAAVELIASDGTRQRVATDPGPAYAGRYAGLMRFFSAAAPAGKKLVSYRLLNAGGRSLIELPLDFDFAPVGRPRRVLTGRALRGRFDLVQQRFSFPLDDDTTAGCLAVVRHGRRARDLFSCVVLTDPGDHLPTSYASGVVSCGLRAVVVVGGTPRAAAAVRLRLDDGSSRPGRLFDSGVGRGFLAVSPAGQGLRSVEILDRSGRALRVYRGHVPPAVRQCGYSFSLSSDQAPRAVSTTVRPAAPSRMWQPYAGLRSLRLTAVPWRRR